MYIFFIFKQYLCVINFKIHSKHYKNEVFYLNFLIHYILNVKKTFLPRLRVGLCHERKSRRKKKREPAQI